MTKKFCHPEVVQSSHDLEGNKNPLSYFACGNHIYEGTLSFSPHANLQYFLLPRPKAFFLLGFELIPEHPLLNFSLSLRP